MITLDKQVKGTELVRDFLLENGVATARFRKRQLFTPYEQRIRLMSENLDKPEEFRTRSLRRKLTRLDRALTDGEAYALDRAFNAWLTLNGKSKSVDPMAVHGGDGQSEPLSQHELMEAKAYADMLRVFNPNARYMINQLFTAMAPWNDEIHRIDILYAREFAKAIKLAYEQKEQKKNLQS